MPNTLILKHSDTIRSVPTTLEHGEVAFNIVDKGMWIGNAAKTPVRLLPYVAPIVHGGVIAQGSAKTAAVVLNTATGQITTAATAVATAAMATDRPVRFKLTNSKIKDHDLILIQHQSGGTPGAYIIWVDEVVAGSCHINIRNITAASLSEALVLMFSIVPGAIA